MRKDYSTFGLISIISVLTILGLISIAPTPVAASENASENNTLEITYIGADDNLVNTWGDNVEITFQVQDENGYKNIKSVEIGIYNSENFREKYDNLEGDVEAVDNGGDISTYSYVFNPDNKFKLGQAEVRITAIDEENHKERRKKEDLFEVTDADLSVTTQDAENTKKISATLHASIDLAGYDKVEARFFYENAPVEKPFDNKTSWENTTSSDYENTIENLSAYTKYEFKASVRLPKNNFEGASQSDNGKILSFSTYPENARVTTGNVTYKDKSHLLGPKPTLHASIDNRGYENVDITFYYRKGSETSWTNTSWENEYTKENYKCTFTENLSKATTYEFYPEIRFGINGNTFYDNGSISTFTTGGVNILTTIPPEVQVNSEQDITIEVSNKYSSGIELREVIVETSEDRFPDKSVNVGTIVSDSSEPATLTYQPLNSGEKTLEFTIEYSAYTTENEFLYSKEKSISREILVTGTEYENAIDLRIPSENPPLEWIFNGETYTAQVEIHNQRPTEISGIKIVGEKIEDYGVGTLQGNEYTTVEIRVPPKDYEVGSSNEINLRAVHELGVSKPLTLEFQVRDENAPVSVYLVRSNSPINLGEKLKFTLVVAASQDSQAQDLEVRSLTENVLPQGYWVGEEMKNPVDQQISPEEAQQGTNLQQLLGGGTGTSQNQGEEEKDRVIIGKRLYFEADDLEYGDNSPKFQVTYELGDKIVKREFKVDFQIYHSPRVQLVLSETVSGEGGEPVSISMEVTNEMSVQAEAVRAVPPENYTITPKPYYWIGPMDSDEFLPVEFTLYETDELKDGENLTFHTLYRVGNREITGPPITVQVNLENQSETPTVLYGVIAVLAILTLIIGIHWYRG